MKLDLYEINRLSPPNLCGLKLWDLGVLAAAISCLRGVLRAHVGGVSALLYGRMILQYSESLRAKTRDNLNMRIKAWVLRCPGRIAHVRSLIGAAAIRRWRTNRLLDYALTRYFDDWKRKFPDGFKGGFKGGDTHPKRTQLRRGETNYNTIRPYIWQPFALVKTLNVQGFLSGKPVTNDHEMQDAYLKLWGVDITSARSALWTQPRPPRTLQPIRFTPSEIERELARELNMEVEPEVEILPPIISVQAAPKRIDGKVENPKLKPGERPSGEKPP